MAISRGSILLGPCIIQMGGATIYTKDDAKAVTSFETFPIMTAAFGKVDERVREIKTEITFTPAGEWEAAALAVLLPYTNPVMGTSLFGAVDTPCVIHPLNGLEKMSYTAAAITKMPDIILSAIKEPLGQCTITCLGKNNAAWSAADKRFTLTGTAAFTDSSFATANVKTVTYTAALAGASAPWDAIKTKDGAVISFNMATKDIQVDDEGTADIILAGLDITVKFSPVGPTLAEVLAKLGVQGGSVARGQSLNAAAANITFTGSGTGSPLVTVNSVTLKSAPQSYGYDNLRHGQLEFVATRTTGSGAMFSAGLVT